MTSDRRLLPRALIAAGLVGFGVLVAGGRAGIPFVPIDDFDKGLWIGGCLGLELMGVLYLVRDRYEVPN